MKFGAVYLFLIFLLNILGKYDILTLEKESTHSKVDAPIKVKCPYGHRLSCLQTG